MQGLTNTQIQSAIEQYRVYADQQGLTRYVNPIITGSVDPKARLDIKTLELAALPDGFDEEQMFKHYISHMAMAFGSDYQEFAPLPGGNLGTSTQSEVLHQKSKGKGPALYRKLIRDAMNFRVLPEVTKFEWDEQDIEADKQVAENKKLRAETRALRIASNEITNEEAREDALAVGDLTQEQFDRGPPEEKPELIMAPGAPSPPGSTGPRGTMARGGDDAKIGGKEEDDIETPFPEFADWYNATYAHKARAGPFEPERQLAEGRFQRAVARAFKQIEANVFKVLNKNAAELGGRKALSDVDLESFWAEQKKVMFDELGDQVDQVVLQGIEQATNLGLAVNFELANDRVSQLVGTYSNTWWAGIESRTRAHMRTAIQAHVQSGASLPVLQKKLAPLFGATRAKVIATTEVTRLFAEGNRVGYKNAIPPVAEVEWRTVLDSAVDPDCEILDGERLSIDDSEFPPIHPRCRCWIAPVVPVGTQSGQALGQQAPKPGAPGSDTGAPINWQTQGVNEVALGGEAAGTVQGGVHTANTRIGQMRQGTMPKHTLFDDTRVLHKRVSREVQGELNTFRMFEKVESGWAPTVYADADGAGHIMRWVDDAGFGGTAQSVEGRLWHTLAKTETRDHGRMSVVDGLVGNTDRHAGNVILHEGRMIPIDNGFATGFSNEFKFADAMDSYFTEVAVRVDGSFRPASLDSFLDGAEHALKTLRASNQDDLINLLRGMEAGDEATLEILNSYYDAIEFQIRRGRGQAELMARQAENAAGSLDISAAIDRATNA